MKTYKTPVLNINEPNPLSHLSSTYKLTLHNNNIGLNDTEENIDFNKLPSEDKNEINRIINTKHILADGLNVTTSIEESSSAKLKRISFEINQINHKFQRLKTKWNDKETENNKGGILTKFIPSDFLKVHYDKNIKLSNSKSTGDYKLPKVLYSINEETVRKLKFYDLDKQNTDQGKLKLTQKSQQQLESDKKYIPVISLNPQPSSKSIKLLNNHLIVKDIAQSSRNLITVTGNQNLTTTTTNKKVQFKVNLLDPKTFFNNKNPNIKHEEEVVSRKNTNISVKSQYNIDDELELYSENIDLIKNEAAHNEYYSPLQTAQGNTSLSKDNKSLLEKYEEDNLSATIDKYKQLNSKYNYLCTGFENNNKQLFEIKIEREAVNNVLKLETVKFETRSDFKTKGKKFESPNKPFKSRNSYLKSSKTPIKLKKTEETNAVNEDSDDDDEHNHKNTLFKLKNQLELLNRQINYNGSIKESYKYDISSILEQLEELKNKIKFHKRNLEIHYHNLLVEGADTRLKGLTWIMIAIWSLGSEVLMSYMPSFLDTELICYFFVRSHMEIELMKGEKILKELKNLVKENRGKEYRSIKSKNKKTFKKGFVKFKLMIFREDESFLKRKSEFQGEQKFTEEQQETDFLHGKIPPKRLSQIQVNRKLRKLRVEYIYNKLNKEEQKLPEIEGYLFDNIESKVVNYSSVKRFLNEKENNKIELKTSQFVSFVEILEGITLQIKEKIKEITRIQTNRIVKEFLTNDYERIYRVNIETVLSAIVGIANVREEMKNFNEEKRNYYHSLKLCRNYNQFEEKYNKLYTSLFDESRLDGKGILKT